MLNEFFTEQRQLVVAAACIVLIPIPFIRVGIAGVLVFVGMIGYKTVTNS